MSIRSYVNNDIFFQDNAIHGVNWEWSSVLPYVVNDIVVYNGSLYRCTTAVTSPTIEESEEISTAISEGTGDNEGKFVVPFYYIPDFATQGIFTDQVYDTYADAVAALGYTVNDNPITAFGSWESVGGAGGGLATWTATGRYANNDIVAFEGNLYRFVTTDDTVVNTDDDPVTSLNNGETNWEEIGSATTNVPVLSSNMSTVFDGINLLTETQTSRTVTFTRRADIAQRPDGRQVRLVLSATGWNGVTLDMGTVRTVGTTPFTLNFSNLPAIPSGQADIEVSWQINVGEEGESDYLEELESGSFYIYIPLELHEGVSDADVQTLAWNATGGRTINVGLTQDEDVRVDEAGYVVLFKPSSLDIRSLFCEAFIPINRVLGTNTNRTQTTRTGSQSVALTTYTYERVLIAKLSSSSPQLKIRLN